MKSFRFRTIASKLSFIISTMVLVLMVLYGYVTYENQMTAASTAMQTELNQLCEMASSSLSLSLWRSDQTSTERILESYINNREVQSIVLYDFSEQPIYTYEKELIASSENLYKKSQDILFEEEIIGRVEITVTDYFTVAYYNNQQIKMISFFLVQILLMIILINRVTTMGLKPLKEVEVVAQNIANGDLDNGLSSKGSDEIQSLSQAVLDMQEKLKSQKKDIELNIIDIHSRNRELASKNIEIESLYQQMKAYSQELESAIEHKNAAYLETVEALAKSIEAKDQYTRGHCERVADLAAEIARRVGLEDEKVQTIRIAATLHDIGKIGIPSSVLNKPGKLTNEEFELIKSHSELGYNIISNIKYLDKEAQIMLQHHERPDGKGYPNHLKANEICYEATIIGVVDAFDAMNSSRSYRDPLPMDRIRQELINGKGTQFDAEIVNQLLEIIGEGNLDEWIG